MASLTIDLFMDDSCADIASEVRRILTEETPVGRDNVMALGVDVISSAGTHRVAIVALTGDPAVLAGVAGAWGMELSDIDMYA